MKRHAFTMIELIFVIVILGILAAVAIPKLAATRDDAKVATKVAEAKQVLTDFGAYYTTHGYFGTVGEMTNVKLYNYSSNSDATGTDMNDTNMVFISFDENVNNGCMWFATGSSPGELEVFAHAGVSGTCDAILRKTDTIHSEDGTIHKFGGNHVTF